MYAIIKEKWSVMEMEELTKLLGQYGRYLELVDSVPYWESQRPELLARIRELKYNRDSKEIDLRNLEEPNFFQRLLGKTEEKKEKLNQQLREATAAWNAAKWELEALDKKLAEGKKELESLEGCREKYAKAKQDASLTSIQEGQLVMEEIAAFAPAAIAAADRILEALEDARVWMQEDIRRTGVRRENRKMEFLSLAEENARRLTEILSIMPEGCGTIGSYLQSPGAYIDAVTSEFGKLDRLNSAIDQVRETRNQLRMLQ